MSSKTESPKVVSPQSVDPLKLIAFDGDDIEVVSAHLQDSAVRAADILWRPAERRVVVALDRFDWEAAAAGTPQYRRRRAALRFERVLGCRCRNLKPDAGEAMLNLLAVSFQPAESPQDDPGGAVVLTFSGGAALRLQVECVEAELADLGPVWDIDCCPDHEAAAPAAKQG